VVYACDHEQGEAPIDPALLELFRRADALILDSQYLPSEYPSRIGWGHSTYEQCAELAEAAGVKRLLLTHHEPTRTDADVANIEARARLIFADTRAAREGMELRLTSMPRAEAICEELTL
jgi:ribonuclease BN (tRNA processing enzyme)